MSGPVLLYDGSCGFCSGVVKFILLRDRHRTLRFAPIGGAYAARIAAAHPEIAGIDSAVWVDGDGARVLTRSAAALRIARYLGGAWGMFAAFWIVPKPIRDAAYAVIARNRHRIGIGSMDDFVPTPAMKERFLEDDLPASVPPAAT